MRRVLIVLASLVVVGAALVGLSGFFAPQPLPPPFLPTLAAELRAEDDSLGFSVLHDPETGRLSVTRTMGAAAEAGQAHRLWVVGADGVRTPVMDLTAEVTEAEGEGLAPGTVLEVTQEPADGPTGPVLMRASLDAI